MNLTTIKPEETNEIITKASAMTKAEVIAIFEDLGWYYQPRMSKKQLVAKLARMLDRIATSNVQCEMIG